MNPQQLRSRRALLRASAYATFGAVGGSVFLSACGEKTPAKTGAGTGTSATKDLTGTLNFVNFEGWLGANTAAAFSTEFPGADLNQIPIAGTQESWLPKVKDRRGDYDLALVDGATIPKLVALDAIASFTPEEVPNQANIDPAFRNQDWDPDNKYFVATDYGRTAIGYRTDLVQEPITSYADVFALLPKYSGKVAVVSRMGSTLGMAMKRLGYSINSNDPGEVAQARDLLIASKKHFLALVDSGSPSLISGDAVIALCDDYDVAAISADNPNIAWVDPTEGVSAYLEGFVALKGPREDLAKAFINFQADPVQNADFANTLTVAPVVPEAASLIKPAITNSPILFPPDDVKERIEFFVARPQEGEALWMKAWDEFRAS
jgi:spermidine/putrescine transport system substrate-binding protein